MKIKPGTIKLVGEIIQTGPIEKVGKKGTSKLTIIIVSGKETEYPNYYPVDFFKNKIDWASQFGVGDEVRIRGVLNGRKYQAEGKDPMYFLGVTGFSIKGADEPERTQEDGDDEDDAPRKKRKDDDDDDDDSPKSKKDSSDDDGDDLPF